MKMDTLGDQQHTDTCVWLSDQQDALILAAIYEQPLEVGVM
jgi:hypothetical protein